MIPERGDVWYAALPLKQNSNIQGGNRPVIIVSNEACNRTNTIVTVVPMSRKKKKPYFPSHVLIDCPDGTQSMAYVEQLMTIDKDMLLNRACSCSEIEMEDIEKAIMGQLGVKTKRRIENEQHHHL